MNKEFRLAPGAMEKIVMRGMNRRIKKTITLANLSTKGKWYVIKEDKGHYFIANVNRPEHVKDFTFEDAQKYAEDPI